jgi:8-oxo-dGTP pyrophosphatase MutT (NUDIX family)
MSARISADDIRRRLAGTRMPANPLDVDVSDLSHRMPATLIEQLLPGLRPAGVLIPLVERRGALSVLLTERSAELRHHAGQVSFPGGGMETGDADIAATALRETREEVGIHPDEVDVAGYLKPTPTVTGYAVTPVVGLISAGFTLAIDPVEVESAFEVPLDFLMDAGNEEHTEREFAGVTVPVVTFHYEGHRIWGATAGMLLTLRSIIIY